MEVSGQLHATATLTSGKDAGTHLTVKLFEIQISSRDTGGGRKEVPRRDFLLDYPRLFCPEYQFRK